MVGLRNLVYYHKGWQPLPQWCNFYLELGKWIKEVYNREHLVIALSVPVRSFVSAFIASGYLAASGTRVIDSQECFRKIASLPRDACIRFMYKDRKTVGIYKGITEAFGEQRIRVQVEDSKSGGLTLVLRPEELAGFVVVDNSSAIKLPARQRGYKLSFNRDFITAFLGVNDITSYLSRSKLESVIVGTVKVIGEELNDYRFGIVKHSGGIVEGRLQDIIMARRFAPAALGFHCDVVSSRSFLQHLDQRLPLVIFDSPTAFLESGSMFTSSIKKVVVLERTNRNYSEAVRQLNQRFYQSRDRTGEVKISEAIPPGVDLMVFEESVGNEHGH